MARDTSRDGFRNKLRYYVLTRFGFFWRLANRWAWLGRRVNRRLIDNAVLQAATRPNPFSTRSAYTSWESLTERAWFGRHLPPKPQKDLPPAAEVAELFRPRPEGRRLSDKSTLLFPAFAQWFTDGFLLTAAEDVRKTHSSHEIDFSPLYGEKIAETRALRLLSERPGEKGRLKSQTLDGAEFPPFLYEPGGEKVKDEFGPLRPPLRLPHVWAPQRRQTLFACGGERANTTPQTAMFNVLFLREHNRLAGELARAYPTWDDERVFQTARNVNTVLLLKVIVEEYINHISPYHFQFRADPSGAWRARWNRPNWFAVEFNLLYRWHSLVPDDIEWGGRSYPGRAWLFDNGPLLAAGLGPAFDSTSRQRAGEVGLFNTPPFLHDLGVEVNSVEQGRANELGTYNDYREANGYPRVTAFEQISGDPEVVAGLRRVYGHVDRVEFYVGLFAEDPRPNAAVPALIGRMVAIDAFSQALLNPLLSEHVFHEGTFSPVGWRVIGGTHSLGDLVRRNVAEDTSGYFISMTRRADVGPGPVRREPESAPGQDGPPV